MKKMIALFVAMVLGIGCAFGQDAQRTPGKGPGRPMMGRMMAQDPEQIVKKYDKDGDGALSVEEIKVWSDEVKARKEEMRRRFLDKDGDGVISEEEQKAGEEMQQRMRQHMCRGPEDLPPPEEQVPEAEKKD